MSVDTLLMSPATCYLSPTPCQVMTPTRPAAGVGRDEFLAGLVRTNRKKSRRSAAAGGASTPSQLIFSSSPIKSHDSAYGSSSSNGSVSESDLSFLEYSGSTESDDQDWKAAQLYECENNLRIARREREQIVLETVKKRDKIEREKEEKMAAILHEAQKKIEDLNRGLHRKLSALDHQQNQLEVKIAELKKYLQTARTLLSTGHQWSSEQDIDIFDDIFTTCQQPKPPASPAVSQPPPHPPTQSHKDPILARRVTAFMSVRGCRSTVYPATGISCTKQHEIIITDLGRDQVTVYNELGQLTCVLNTLPYDAPTKAVHVDVGELDHIAVACKTNVKMYCRKTGEYSGKLALADVDSPRAVTMHGDNIVIADARTHGAVIAAYKLQGYKDCRKAEMVQCVIGGRRAPCFTEPRYVCHDATGNLYVSDVQDHKVKVLCSKGSLITELGGYGAAVGQLCQPGGVCVDSDGNLLVADTMNQRVVLWYHNTRQCCVVLETEQEDRPMDVAMYCADQFLVLHANGKVSIYEYMTRDMLDL